MICRQKCVANILKIFDNQGGCNEYFSAERKCFQEKLPLTAPTSNEGEE